MEEQLDDYLIIFVSYYREQKLKLPSAGVSWPLFLISPLISIGFCQQG